MKTIDRSSCKHRSWRNRLGAPLLVLVIASTLTALADEPPPLDIDHAAAVISWPASGKDYIVLSSATPDGPWIPCLDPVAQGPGVLQMAVHTTDHSRYFKLAKGQRFMDDFDDGDLEGWTVGFSETGYEEAVTVETTGGKLRIHGACPECDAPNMGLYLTNLLLADFTVSVDILDWDISAGPYNTGHALFARIDPDHVTPTRRNKAYMGGFLVTPSFAPSYSALWIYEVTGPTSEEQLGDITFFPPVSHTRDYRLVFTGVGSQLTLQLFDLTDGSLVAENQAVDDTLTEGWVGIWGSGRTTKKIDITLDNFVAVGTTPSSD